MAPAPHHPCITAVLVLALASLSGCSDEGVSGPSSKDVAHAISDGGHNGNEHFFFLPPMAPSLTYTGDFDATYAAEVRICEWDGAACVGSDVAHFTTFSGTGSEIIRIDPAAEVYMVAWHTRLAHGGTGLDPAKMYRVIVSSDGYVLGYADVDVVSTGKDLRNVDTNEYVALKDGGVLQIKFRIEVGAVPAAKKLSVASGRVHSCALNPSGSAYCWGSNELGQLGLGIVGGYYATPQPVEGSHTFTQIESGGNYNCGIKSDGSAWCWGYSGSLIGDGTPTAVAAGLKFTDIAIGLWHACGITTGQEAYCWGRNFRGQLGNGTVTPSDGTYWPPAPVLGSYSFVSLDSRYHHTCGMTTTGAAICWGGNEFGELGRGYTTPSIPYGIGTPQVAMTGIDFRAITAGYGSTCGITTANEAYCVGLNSLGTLGGGFTSPTSTSPVQVQGGIAFSSIDLGGFHACGINTTGDAYCWGANGLGQIGTGSTSGLELVPRLVTGGHSWSDLALGTNHTCGTTRNAVRCWGLNDVGQVTGTNATESSPVEIILP